MKNYNKEELLDLIQDNTKLHNEISNSQGLVLFKMKQFNISIEPDLLLVPHMSAWAIPYLNEREDELTTQQLEIVKYVSSGKNYWINNNITPLEVDNHPFKEKLYIDDLLLQVAAHSNTDFVETKVSLHKLAKSINVNPIHNLKELTEITDKLHRLYISLHENNFNSQYFNGKKDLVKTIVEATTAGNYRISKEEILTLDSIWVSDFSLEIFNEHTLSDIVEMEYTEKQWEVILKHNEKYNKDGLESLVANNQLIPLKVLRFFLVESLENKSIAKYCEKYLLSNWSDLPLSIINQVKDNEFKGLDSTLFISLPIDLQKSYNKAYQTTGFLLGKKDVGFQLSLEQAKQKLKDVAQYNENERFEHVSFISNHLVDLDWSQSYNFVSEISKHIEIPSHRFNEILNEKVFKYLDSDKYISLLARCKDIYVSKYSEEDYYHFITYLLVNSYLSHDLKENVRYFQSTLTVNHEKIIDSFKIGEVLYFLYRNVDSSDFMTTDMMKKITSRFDEINDLKVVRYDLIFDNVLDKKIEEVKSAATEDVAHVSAEINKLFLDIAEDLRDSPLTYLIWWGGSKNTLLESWKYWKDDLEEEGKSEILTSSDYRHKFVCEHMDIDLFNRGLLELKHKLRHLDNNSEYGDITAVTSTAYEDFALIFRRLYGLTWSESRVSSGIGYENKSFLSLDKKDKIWGTIESNFPEFFINMDACNLSTSGFDDVKIKDWTSIFKSLSNNEGSDGNYRKIDMKNTDSILDSFLNYDANTDMLSLEYLQNMIFVGLNSKNIRYIHSYDNLPPLENITSAIRDWYHVRDVKSSLLIKGIINNDMRVKEIEALYEFNYLNSNIGSKAIKNNVFKV